MPPKRKAAQALAIETPPPRKTARVTKIYSSSTKKSRAAFQSPQEPTPSKQSPATRSSSHTAEPAPTPQHVKLKSIAESGILEHKLRISKAHWLESVLPKYWAKPKKTKGYVEDPKNPKKESMTRLGPCRIVIAPHVFDALLFTIKDPNPPPPPPPPPPQQPVFRQPAQAPSQPPLHYNYQLPPPPTTQPGPVNGNACATRPPQPATQHPPSTHAQTSSIQGAVTQSQPVPSAQAPPVAQTLPQPQAAQPASLPATAGQNAPASSAPPPVQTATPAQPLPPSTTQTPNGQALAQPPAQTQASLAGPNSTTSHASTSSPQQILQQPAATGPSQAPRFEPPTKQEPGVSGVQAVPGQQQPMQQVITQQLPQQSTQSGPTGTAPPTQQVQQSAAQPQQPQATPQQQQAPQSKQTQDPVIQALAARASADPSLKELMKVVASGSATQEQLAAFQVHIDELTAQCRRAEAAGNAARPQPHQTGNARPVHTQSRQPPPQQQQQQQQQQRPYQPSPSQYQQLPPKVKAAPAPPPLLPGVVIEFVSGSGDRFWLPKNSLLDYNHERCVLASFLVVWKGSRGDHGRFDSAQEYYVPLTLRIESDQPPKKVLHPLARCVNPYTDVQAHMAETMAKHPRADDDLVRLQVAEPVVAEDEADIGTTPIDRRVSLLRGAVGPGSASPASETKKEKKKADLSDLCRFCYGHVPPGTPRDGEDRVECASCKKLKEDSFRGRGVVRYVESETKPTTPAASLVLV